VFPNVFLEENSFLPTARRSVPKVSHAQDNRLFYLANIEGITLSKKLASRNKH